MAFVIRLHPLAANPSRHSDVTKAHNVATAFGTIARRVKFTTSTKRTTAHG